MTKDAADGAHLDAPPVLTAFLDHCGVDSYEALVARADRDPDWFWPHVMAFHDLRFSKPYERLLDLSQGREWPRWCVGGELNIAANCLDRTLERVPPDKPAILWEAEDGARRRLTYAELRAEVARCAGALDALGVRQGEVVGVFMPSVPEAIVALLAVMSMGAIALPMFSGFAAQALVQRLADAGAAALITADVTYRRGKRVELAKIAREAAADVPSVRHILVVAREDEGGDALSWRKLLNAATPLAPRVVAADSPAMLVYTSGTTGKAKGTIHTHCGFLTKVALDVGTILDLQENDRLLWMADLGWLTGPLLAVAAPLVGATLVLAEGVPDYPVAGRLWRLAQDHLVTFLGVAPTMVRAVMQHPADALAGYDLSSLRVCASTGEPWTPEAWDWFKRNICRNGAPLLNYSGGTEIGGGILAGTRLHPDLKPCAFAGPIPGMGAAILDENGAPTPRGKSGELCLTIPSIGLTRGLWNNPQGYIDAYWSKSPGVWAHGDLASIDADGQWFVHGRSDDTIKIAGKRTGPAEIEALLLAEGLVAEAAAVAVPDSVKGSAVVCVCVPARGAASGAAEVKQLKSAVAQGLGVAFRPKSVLFVADLPKTRSMKIMRRVVRDCLCGEPPGDLSGLADRAGLDAVAVAAARWRADSSP